MYRIDLVEIQAFLTVAKFLSFTKAADALYMTQPTVTKLVRHLEEEIGVRLLNRSSRSVALTPAGELLVDRWKDQLAQIEASIMDAQETALQKRSLLRIAALQGYGFEDLLSDSLRTFADANPQLGIEFNIYDLHSLQEQLELQDIILTIGFETGTIQDFVVKELDTLPLYLAVSKESPLATQDSVALGRLGKESFLVLSSKISPDAQNLAADIFKNAGITPRIIPVENVPSQMLRIAQGEGVALTGASTVRGYEEKVALVALADLPMKLTRVIAYRPGKQSEAARRFCSFLISQLAPHHD